MIAPDLLNHLTVQDRRRLLRTYQFAITQEMLEKVKEPGVRRQFVPDSAELAIAHYELSDPIYEQKDSPYPQMVHRYRNRVLWKIASTCAVYCRFCFRKEHIGRHGTPIDSKTVQAIYQYLSEHKEVEEVILSGGDPLTLSPERLHFLITPLKDMTHIRRIRIHTRIPVVAPSRVSLNWFDMLETIKKSVVIVLHINHAQELSAASDACIEQLRQRYLILSQSVLLRGVNDKVSILATLFNSLLERGIHPYYLHHLDSARGTGHFRLTLAEGKALYQALCASVSGIALPTYIIELENGRKKPVLALSDDEIHAIDAKRC